MKYFESEGSMREFLAFIIAISVIRGVEYYLFSQNILTNDQYRLSIQALVALVVIYLITLVIRNQNIMKLRPSRHTRTYEGEELDAFIIKLRDEGKSLEEISIASGLTIEEVKKKLDIQKE